MSDSEEEKDDNEAEVVDSEEEAGRGGEGRRGREEGRYTAEAAAERGAGIGQLSISVHAMVRA